MKVTITSIFKKERTSARTGKEFTSMSIKTQEHGDKWLGGFFSEENKNWKEGDVVDIEVTTKGDYLNYSLPKGRAASPSNNQVVTLLETKVIPMLQTIIARLPDLKTGDYPPMTSANDGDLPF